MTVAIFMGCSKDSGLINPHPADSSTTTPNKPSTSTSSTADTSRATPGSGNTNPGTTNPGTTNPGTTNPGTTNPGTTNPGTTNPGTTSPGTTNPGTGGTSSGVAGNNIDRATLLNLVNDVRSKGCNCGGVQMPPVGPLVWNDQLEKAAYNFSVDMNTKNYFSHTGADGSTPGTRITATGYQWNTYGENIANGYMNEQAVIQGWINSPGHCKNIMTADFKDIGIGRSGNYWTMDLARKR
ncbi:CAP domain-containing protein [Chitinophaga sp. HK235]|uniref:CAP domain-containing protein n=1 Tax=Chitinophaga sp. HK235 TaxID=2952571 RepID=UPI0020130355|nr:CAP domain-containing protein [Chitinophaga sp. HK235]